MYWNKILFIQYYPIITIIIHFSKMQVKKTVFYFCHKKPRTSHFFLDNRVKNGYTLRKNNRAATG